MNVNNKKFFTAFIFIAAVSLIFSVALAGCAPVEPDVIHNLKAQVKKLNERTTELSQSDTELENKLSQMQLNLANSGVQISDLEAKVSDINGKYEVESHNLGLLQKNFEAYRVMVNKELVRLLKLPESGPVPAAGKQPAAPKISSQETVFKKAMLLYNNKNFAASASAFSGFLDKYPQSSYAAEAMFYKAEANFNLKKYPVSILEFHKFSQIYPKNANVPMAIYFQGIGFLKVSDPSDASILFRQVIAKYPDSEAARLSKKELGRLSR